MAVTNIYFKCSCQKFLAVDMAGIGRTVGCPNCEKPVTIPQPEIEWECQCGSPMMAPASMCGETVQCVECQKDVSVPLVEESDTTGSCEKVKTWVDKQRRLLKPIAIAASIILVLGLAVAAWLAFGRGKSDAEQQYKTGVKYFQGDGLTQDYGKAFECFRKAAEQGLAAAQNNLGVCYDQGAGIDKDLREAVKWYKKAAEQGLANAQHNLGYCYAQGAGIDKDLREAVKWFRKAAEQGFAKAQINLGYCYAQGAGIDKDLREAVKWFRKAAEQGLAEAQHNLGYCYAQGTGIDKDLREAVKWYKKAAEQGLAAAQNNLELCYAQGTGVDEDLKEAGKWSSLNATTIFERTIKSMGFRILQKEQQAPAVIQGPMVSVAMITGRGDEITDAVGETLGYVYPTSITFSGQTWPIHAVYTCEKLDKSGTAAVLIIVRVEGHAYFFSACSRREYGRFMCEIVFDKDASSRYIKLLLK